MEKQKKRAGNEQFGLPLVFSLVTLDNLGKVGTAHSYKNDQHAISIILYEPDEENYEIAKLHLGLRVRFIRN